MEHEEGSTFLQLHWVSANLTLMQSPSHCSDTDVGSCSVLYVVLGSFRGERTRERQDILVLLALHLAIWLGRVVKKMRVEGKGFYRKMGWVHSALNELCKTSQFGIN